MRGAIAAATLDRGPHHLPHTLSTSTSVHVGMRRTGRVLIGWKGRVHPEVAVTHPGVVVTHPVRVKFVGLVIIQPEGMYAHVEQLRFQALSPHARTTCGDGLHRGGTSKCWCLHLYVVSAGKRVRGKQGHTRTDSADVGFVYVIGRGRFRVNA